MFITLKVICSNENNNDAPRYLVIPIGFLPDIKARIRRVMTAMQGLPDTIPVYGLEIFGTLGQWFNTLPAVEAGDDRLIDLLENKPVVDVMERGGHVTLTDQDPSLPVAGDDAQASKANEHVDIETYVICLDGDILQLGQMDSWSSTLESAALDLVTIDRILEVAKTESKK